jgi:hypothetical protein
MSDQLSTQINDLAPLEDEELEQQSIEQLITQASVDDNVSLSSDEVSSQVSSMEEEKEEPRVTISGEEDTDDFELEAMKGGREGDEVQGIEKVCAATLYTLGSEDTLIPVAGKSPAIVQRILQNLSRQDSDDFTLHNDDNSVAPTHPQAEIAMDEERVSNEEEEKGGEAIETKNRFTPRIFKINSLRLAERGIKFKKSQAVPHIYCLQMETYYRSILQQIFKKRVMTLLNNLKPYAKICNKKNGEREIRWSKKGIVKKIHHFQRQQSISLNEMSVVLQTNKFIKPYVRHTMIPVGPNIRPGSHDVDTDAPSTLPVSQKQAREQLRKQKQRQQKQKKGAN